MIEKNQIKFCKIFLTLLVIIGTYLAVIGGYGSDEDTLPMIGVFIGILHGGELMSSRFTGYPVAEIGIGFLSYYFGSFVVNIITFLNFLIGLIFFYLSFQKKYNKEILYFLIACLTNSVLFFDNLEPMDYSWALLFFSLGLFSFSRKYFEFAVIFFGICIGTRINFTIFVIFAIAFFPLEHNQSLYKKISIILISIFIGGLFYTPIWYQNQFGLDWLTAARPLEQGFTGLLVRFIYKTSHAIGLILLFFLISNIFLRKIKFFDLYKNKVIFYLAISNLLLFLYIPAELGYLQIFLISMYYFIVRHFNKKIFLAVILINLSGWLVNFDIIKIEHKYSNVCDAVQATGASFDFQVKKGSFKKFLDTRSLIECWVTDKNSDYGQKIISGKPLR